MSARSTAQSNLLADVCVVAEPEELAPDSLTCGVCRKEFPLAEIVRFIQHKVHACNKENYRLAGQSGGRPGRDDAVSAEAANGPAPSVCSRRPSISAPINARKLNSLAVSSSAAEVADEDAADDAVKTETDDQPRARSTVDAESNTVSSGESSVVHLCVRIGRVRQRVLEPGPLGQERSRK